MTGQRRPRSAYGRNRADRSRPASMATSVSRHPASLRRLSLATGDSRRRLQLPVIIVDEANKPTWLRAPPAQVGGRLFALGDPIGRRSHIRHQAATRENRARATRAQLVRMPPALLRTFLRARPGQRMPYSTVSTCRSGGTVWVQWHFKTQTEIEPSATRVP